MIENNLFKTLFIMENIDFFDQKLAIKKSISKNHVVYLNIWVLGFMFGLIIKFLFRPQKSNLTIEVKDHFNKKLHS